VRLLALLVATFPAGAEPRAISYWIAPCAPVETACAAGDVELARWALEAWEKASGGALRLEETREQDKSLIRIHWVAGDQGRYGEAVPIQVGGRRGALVFVRPDLRQLGAGFANAGEKDPLFRETIVYLTCLHETGHALGLPHTAAFDDIMYSFAHGGDIREYFQRYRRKLGRREDIRRHPGISASDRLRLAEHLRREP